MIKFENTIDSQAADGTDAIGTTSGLVNKSFQFTFDEFDEFGQHKNIL